ncbi:unnamed protein product [Withania somnifera]
MAGLNILSQSPSPWQLSASSTSSSSYSFRLRHFCEFNIYNCGDIKCCKLGSSNFTLSGNPIPKRPPLSSQMLPHLSNSSGSGYSWMQDKCASCDNFSSNGRKQGAFNAVSAKEQAQVSSVDDLYDFICSGPLINKIGLTPEKVAESVDKWIEYGLRLCRLFQLNQLALNEAQKFESTTTIFQSSCGVNRKFHSIVPSSKKKKKSLHWWKAATISIDDFYLTAEEQAKLRDSNPGNLLLEFRGNAGSHDLPFSVETLTGLSKLTKEGVKMKLPRYDKSAYSGRGDRADPSTWPEVEGPLPVILFEGWMLGFKPLPPEVVKAVDPQLEMVNKNLEAYYDAWHKYVKSWIVIKIQDPSYVYQWRLQAEIAMRADGKPGMSDEEVLDFVSRYLPAYEAYLPTLYSEGPSGSDPEHVLLIDIDEGRNPILGC